MEKTDLPTITLQKDPSIDPTAFIAPGAHVIGDVTIGKSASIWYNAVLRGDINRIEIGDETNIQDGVVVHVENQRPVIVGPRVTVGHQATLHGCQIDEGVLVGISATILSGAHLKRGAVVAAGAVVREGQVVEANSLVGGVPAKIIKELDETSFETNLKWAAKYARLAELYNRKS